MGCISTPIPNYLSTRLLLFYHIRVVRMKGKEQCGDGKSGEKGKEQRGNHNTQGIKNNTTE